MAHRAEELGWINLKGRRRAHARRVRRGRQGDYLRWDHGRYGLAAARIAPRSPISPPIVPDDAPYRMSTMLTTPATIAPFMRLFFTIAEETQSAPPRTTLITNVVTAGESWFAPMFPWDHAIANRTSDRSTASAPPS